MTDSIENWTDNSIIRVYPIIEIFDSIQGEGAFIGMPVSFIRLAGCNLSCPWCDTKESWKTNEDTLWLSIEDIADQCKQNIIVITGGEPCLHDLEPLRSVLQGQGKFTCLETNGTLATGDGFDWVTCSPKPPEYRIHEQCWFSELKYVVDENFTLDCIPPDQKQTTGTIWLQPCDYGFDSKKTKASQQKAFDLVMQNKFLRMGIQLHKVLEVK